MILRHLADLKERTVSGQTWTSRRLLLAEDAMGFSMHDTVMKRGSATKMWYQNHLEAVYCIAGHGRIDDLETGETHPIEPGTLYALDHNDRHVLHAVEELRVVCVFNPPLLGPESHDENGAYPLLSAES